jgi:hypothetical protein
MTDHDDVGKRSSGGRAEHVVIVGHVDCHHRRIRRLREQVRGAALGTVRARHTLPIRLGVLTRCDTAEVLRHVAALDGVRSGQRERRHRDGAGWVVGEEREREYDDASAPATLRRSGGLEVRVIVLPWMGDEGAAVLP